MRRLIITLLAAATVALVPASTALADVVHAEGASTGNDFRLTWAIDWDSGTRDVTVNVTQTDLLTGLPSNAKGIAPPGSGSRDGAGVDVVLGNGQVRTVDFFAQGFVNAGPVVIQNVNAKSYLQRGGGSGLTYNDWYTPPAR
jgi:hypothetical protein